MKTLRFAGPHARFGGRLKPGGTASRSAQIVLLASLLEAATSVPALHAADPPPAVSRSDNKTPVTVIDRGSTFALSNGIVTARINKRNGDLESLIYKGLETMGHDQGRAGYWEQDPSAAVEGRGLDSVGHDRPGEKRRRAGRGVHQGRSPGATHGGADPRVARAPASGTGELRHGSALLAGPRRERHLRLCDFLPPGKLRATPDAGEPLHHQDQPGLRLDFGGRRPQHAAMRSEDWGTGVVVHAKEQRILTRGVYKNSVEHKYSYNCRPVQDPRVRLVQHEEPRRHLVHQPDHRIPQRRRIQAGVGLPLRG